MYILAELSELPVTEFGGFTYRHFTSIITDLLIEVLNLTNSYIKQAKSAKQEKG